MFKRRRAVSQSQRSPLHFSFLLSSFGSITRLVIYRCVVFLFPAILIAQVLVGSMGNTPPIWVNGVGDISAAVSLSWRFLYICVLEDLSIFYSFV